MKLLFTKSDLLTGINTVYRAVPSKTTLPILYCILISAETEEITLTANNTELGIETKVSGKIIERGKIALEAKLFSDIIRKLPENGLDIIITSDDLLHTKIESGSSVFYIQGQDGDEFSPLPYIEKENYISLSQFTLREAVRQTIFSADVNDSNRMLGGALFQVNGNHLQIVTLDGHRVSVRNIELRDTYTDQESIIPVRSLNEVTRIAGGGAEDEILIFFSKNHVLFEFGLTHIVSRLIEGRFFQVKNMFSKDYEIRVKVNRRRFIDQIESVMAMMYESERSPLVLIITDDSMGLRLKSSRGLVNAGVEIGKTGKDVTIAFNPRFLVDALRAIDDEEVEIYLINPKSPCLIKDEEESYIYVLLPVNFYMD